MTATLARHPLPAAQAGIWAGQRLAPDDPMYNTGEYVDLTGPLDPAAFGTALRRTTVEAQALHARYPGDGALVLAAAGDPDVSTVDFRTVADPLAAALAWMRADLERPVDLRTGPLFRHAVLRVADDRHLWFQRIHHVAADGYAFTLLARRVAAHYTALVSGAGQDGRTAFAPLADALAEDAAYHGSARQAADRAFWLDRYADRPTVATLSGGAGEARGGARRHTVALPDADLLRTVAAAHRLTWSDLAIGGFAGYVGERVGAPEVVLGLPVAGRLGSAALRVPCMWMNIVPLRIATPPGAGLLTLARSVAAEVAAVRRHSRYRYEWLRRDLGLLGGERRLFGPVVNVLAFDHGLRFAGLRASVHNVSAGPVEDLSLALHDRAGALVAELDANPDRYPAGEAADHATGWLELLTGGLNAPGRPCVTPVRWLDGGPLPVPPRPVPDMIAEHAAARPDRTAVVHEGRSVSYGALHAAATALATRLVAAGAGRGGGARRPVAVALTRGVDAVVAVLGALYSGVPYLPVDPDGPAERVATVFADADPAIVITTDRYAHLATGRRLVPPTPADSEPPTGAAPVGAAPAGAAPVGAAPAGAAPVAAAALPDRWPGPAYVIYTSGSTGTPNGVVVGHRALAAFVAGATARYGVTAADRVLQFAPLQFDASVEELFVTLCAGATLVVRPTDTLDVTRLFAAVRTHGITVLDLPTAYWHEVAYAVGTGAVTVPDCVRTVIIGGEPALPARVALWRRSAPPHVRLLNTYGPTEATVVATVANLGAAGLGDTVAEVPIGKPLPGVRAAIVRGELYLAGGGLAEGYLNRPEHTAARFITLDGVRAYRTGDRARQRADGQLAYAGRVDDEVKISGYRVDLQEIESVLLRHPLVRDAAVVASPTPGGVPRLIAHVVPGQGAGAEAGTEAEVEVGADVRAEAGTEAGAGTAEVEAALRAHCARLLPGPLVPGRFATVARLPRTGTGKIDRAALRDLPTASAPATGSTVGGSGTALERLVAGVWAEVLGTRPDGPGDDFFALGGQSLQTVQVATRLAAALGREVPVALVFRYPTVGGLAAALTDTPHRDSGDEAHLRDAVLPDEIRPAPGRRPRTATRARTVLLTGATGFVGRYLLAELLRTTTARVVCPVRAVTARQAADRVSGALAAAAPDVPEDGRVRAIPADLARPRLGLGPAGFDALADDVDAIYHSAAVVSVARDYSSVRATNVLGTREVLRLATTRRPSAVHHISTVAVLPPDGSSSEAVDAHPGLRDGYQRSKWAAERLVLEAGRRGLPVSVYRLGRVTGPATTAAVNADDLVWRLVRAAVAIGAVPDLDVAEPWTPADAVARSVVRQSLCGSRVVDLIPPSAVRLAHVFDRLTARGHALPRVPAGVWASAVAGGEHAALAEVVRALAARERPAAERLRTVPTADPPPAAGAHHDLDLPAIGTDLIDRYLDTAVADGLIPPGAQ